MRIFLSVAAILPDENTEKWLPERKLFPQLDHRISTAAGSDDRDKFALFYLKSQIRQGVGLTIQCVIGIRQVIYL